MVVNALSAGIVVIIIRALGRSIVVAFVPPLELVVLCVGREQHQANESSDPLDDFGMLRNLPIYDKYFRRAGGCPYRLDWRLVAV